MKPIIIDMKDMSDSREVYESRPNPVLAGFIYLILALVVAAFVWMYFSKMDIVVKATGTVAASEEVATVTNQVAGVILERCIEDGQEVKAGDVLYTVSHEEQKLQLETLTKQLQDCEEKEEMLKAYEAWLENGEEFPAELGANAYFGEVTARRNLIESGQENILQAYSGEMSAYNVKMISNEEQISYYEEAVAKLKQVLQDVKSRKNSFQNQEILYWNMVESYLVKYQQILNTYDSKLNELYRLSSSPSVSGGDANGMTVGSATEEITNSIRQTEVQKQTELNLCEKETVAAIENMILEYQQNIAAYQGVLQEYENSREQLKEEGTDNKMRNLVAQEMYNISKELEECKVSQMQLVTQISKLEEEISNATVLAKTDGQVHFLADLVEGDYLGAGMQTLTIIPGIDTTSFVVKSFVENTDIAKLREGMKVTYEIGAYPSKEYGTMNGEVTFVSADLKVNDSGSAYYIVETSVMPQELRNRKGEEAVLKVGMLCQTKIIVEEKTVWDVLLEKLFHVVR